MTGRRFFTLAGTMVLLASVGCGTTYNFASHPEGPTIYGGVVFDVELLDPRSSCKGLGVVFGPLDLPFSLVLDTATLPVTAVCELLGWRRSKRSPPTSAGGP
jgi:uncharacterized protein YceK